MGEARRVRAAARKHGLLVPVPVRPTGGVEVRMILPRDVADRLDKRRGDLTRRQYIDALIVRDLETLGEKVTRLVLPATAGETQQVMAARRLGRGH